MKRLDFTTPLAALVALSFAVNSASAAFHLWTFSEVFTNEDGSVQFIELFTSSGFETVSNGAQIRTDSGNSYTISGNLSGSTTNRRLLFATSGFADLTGAVTPNYTLPVTNFFNPAGDRIRIFHPSFGEFHSRTFTLPPIDGVNSLNYPPAQGAAAVNSPTNFAGAAGSVDVSPPTTTGDYNNDLTVDAADYTVWRDTFGREVDDGTGADGDADGTIDDGDFDFWKSKFGDVIGGSVSASVVGIVVPEPTVLSLTACAVFGLFLPRRCARPGQFR